MQVLHAAVAIAAWLIALAWVAKFFEAARGLALVPNLLAAEYDAEPAGMPSITVIVPARNEAANVRACLESLLGQDYANLRIVAIDDRSSDGTGAIMDVLAGDARLEVMHIATLPEGWLGKTHAMAVAAQHAVAGWEPEYLLFTDADVVFRADAIRRSLVEVAASQADHFVTVPTTLTKTWGESMILAYLQVISVWEVRMWKVADPKAKHDALGVGAFNLVRTKAYQGLGGFEATPMEILEDLTFGRRVKSAGLRQRVATAPGAVSVHWAAGVQGIVNGMTKNVFAVFHFRPLLLLAAAVGMAVQCLGPVGLLVVQGARLPAVLALAAVFGVYWLTSRTSRISPGYAVMFPLAAALVVYAMLRSMVITVHQGGVIWRGTFYPLDELRRHDQADVHLVS